MANAHDSLGEAARSTLADFFDAALYQGFSRIGQAVFGVSGDRFHLCHADDEGRSGLEVFDDPHDASRIALLDDEGNHRPLKTAPNLRRGWILKLPTSSDLRLAIDLLYPAALANWRGFLRAEPLATPLRRAFDRQTGMYRITGLTTDPEAEKILNTLCKPGCLRQILWPIPDGVPFRSPVLENGRIPLLCTDACSLLIGEARRVVKCRPPAPVS
jgi:hypothetical protein